MRRAPRLVLIAAFALLLNAPIAAQGGRFDLDRTKTVLTGMIEQIIKERGVPSISIALVRGDSIVWKAAFGYANVRTKTAATPETIYSTGSTFKAATATARAETSRTGTVSKATPTTSAPSAISPYTPRSSQP